MLKRLSIKSDCFNFDFCFKLDYLTKFEDLFKRSFKGKKSLKFKKIARGKFMTQNYNFQMDLNVTSREEDEERQLDIGQMTILQKEEAEEARRLHRENMSKKQKGFKGEKAFIAKPAEIAFRDFSVGKPHYLVITITNVSNAFNSFNVLPLPEKIRNYFEVEYQPKGKIAPGISCDIKFKFFPQLNEDIFSEFTIHAETGKISFPIICTYRKTIIRCDDPRVCFGRIIYGQSKKISLVIKNDGSLPSQYSFMNVDTSDLGSNNSKEQLAIIDNLNFEKRGDIQGNIEKSISFQLAPKEVGPFEFKMLLITKNSLHSPPIPVTIEGECVEVPVRVEKQRYNMQICLLGHIYRQKIKFYNKSEGPVSFKMVQLGQTKKYFEFNPVIGYIQKQSSIDIWVKFTADKDLVNFLNKFMVEKNIYIVPFQMNVKEQVLPVEFQLQFKITSDRINIRPPELNFGKLFEGLSSKIEVEFQNQSELPQQILLYPLKKNIYIENDQPLFKLLPMQTLKTFIVYRSKKLEDSKNYREEDYIGCKIITGEIATNKIDIHYSCEVVKADLTVTSNKIDFCALQVGQITQAATSLKNNTNKEIIFQIFVPDFDVCGLKVTPVVRVLPPKQEVQVNIEYHSFFKTLNPALLNKILQKKLPKAPAEEKKPEEVIEKKETKKEAKKEAKLTKQQQEQLQAEQKRQEEEERLRKEKEEQARLQLQRNFNSQAELIKMGGKLFNFEGAQHYQWLLPVYFKQKDYSDVSAEVNFLEVTTTSITQVLSIDQPEIDFGEIAVGTRAVRQVVISNSGSPAQLKKKSMPIFCSFNVLNSLRQVEQDKPFRAVIEFQPIEEQRFEQRIEFFTDQYTVSCKVKGKGVRPQVQIEPESGLVNMGGVLIQESMEKTVKVKNICNFDINFSLQKIGGGILNTNSGSAFTYVPAQGVIPAHGTVEIKARFRPDRISERYFQKIKVHIEEQKTVRYFYFSGSCFTRQAYVSLYRPPLMPEDSEVRIKAEYAFDALRIKDQEKVLGLLNKKMVLEYIRVTEGNKEEKCYKRKISIGSCKLLDPKMEKPTAFEIIMPKDDRFQCDNLKGTANPGTETVVTFTYKPQEADPLVACIPELSGIGQWKQIKAELKMSGGFMKAGGVDSISFDVVLRFYVNQL